MLSLLIFYIKFIYVQRFHLPVYICILCNNLHTFHYDFVLDLFVTKK